MRSRLPLVALAVALAATFAASACGSTPRQEAAFDPPVDAAPSATPTDAAPSPSTPPLFTDAATGDATVPSPEPPTEVDVVLTADNAYAFGWGDVAKVNTYRNIAAARLASEIFNCPLGNGPEAWVVPAADAPPGAFLYVVAWADRATSQGVIGQFRRRGGAPIFTGDGAWEACATGREYNTSSAPAEFPTQAIVNDYITVCNAGSGDPATTSAGWVGTTAAVTPGAVGRVAFGEDNTAGGTFPVVCEKDATGAEGVAAAARWMWYSPDGTDPFRYVGPGNSTRTFLIFRLPARALPSPPK